MCVWHVRCACAHTHTQAHTHTHTQAPTYSRCAHRAQTHWPCNVVLCSCPQAMLCCVVLIVQFSSRNTSYCSGCGFAATCMDCWWDEGCYPCSYCGNQYGATYVDWLCVDVWHMSPRADEAWERECVPPYELFTNLHVVWTDRYWPRSRTWISKCVFCESVTWRQNVRPDFRLRSYLWRHHPF